MRSLTWVLIAALSGPAVAAPPKPSASEKPSPAVAALDPRVEAIDGTLDRGDWRAAADAAGALLTDPAASSVRGPAWTRLGRALLKGGLPYAALVSLTEGARLAPADAAASYGELATLAFQLHEEAFVGRVVGEDFSVPMNAGLRGQVAFLAAKAAFAEGAWGTALGLLPLVPQDASYALDAQVLQGVALSQQARHSDALVPLLTAYERARAGERDPHYVATLALNVARTFYAQGNFGRAMEYYDKVPRSDAAWAEAHFERAWAHFRVDDMPGTIGLLTTHASPFFDDGYWPEAAMLRAQALYLMCKFGEVETSVEAFRTRYAPLQKAIDTAVSGMTPADALADARTLRTGGSPRLPSAVVARFGTEARIGDALAALDVAAADLSRLGKTGGEAEVAKLLAARRDERIQTEGGRVLEAAKTASAELDEMLADLELTLVDIGSQLADLYQQAAATGEVLDTETEGQVRELRKKGKRVWPFQGEYWADELGWFRVVARPECPESLRRSR